MAGSVLAAVGAATAAPAELERPALNPSTPEDFGSLVGTCADIAPSAYQYRADRRPEDNPPESWLALMWFAHQALNKPVNVNAPAIKQVLCGLLWEEIRPVQRIELTWSAGLNRRPGPNDVAITTLDNKGSSSSWWNNLNAVPKPVKATLSADGKTGLYDLPTETCGIVVSVAGGQSASEYDVPAVKVLVADLWKKMDLEIEWGFERATLDKDHSGRIETYDGKVAGLRPLDGDVGTTTVDSTSWRSVGMSPTRRGLKASLLYIGTAKWRRVLPYTSQRDDVARTIVTLWTKAGNFSFLAADLENGPVLAPEYGFFVRRTTPPTPLPTNPASNLQVPRMLPATEPPLVLTSQAASAREFIAELQARKLSTIRQQTRSHEEQTWEGAVTAMRGTDLPSLPAPPERFEPPMRVQVPSERLTAQWNLGVWHLLRHSQKNPKNGRQWFNDYPYGILGAETYLILRVLDLMGSHHAAEDGVDRWVSLPMDPSSSSPGHHEWALPDRPNGLFTDGHGCLTHAVGPPGVGGHMDGVHAFGPGSIGWALSEHYWLTGDTEWLRASAPRIKANAEWMLRQRRVVSSLVPGGDRLWCKGLQPALQVTPDSGGLWMQSYECEGYYSAAVSRLAATVGEIDPEGGAKLRAEADAYGQDLRAAVDRSIALSPVVPVRDGTFHSVIPFACYVRGLATGPWGWKRDGSGEHVGPLYWDTVQSAAALISPAGLLPPNDVRVQGYLDVLEDRLLLENPRVGQRDWFLAGWQHQGGLERTANLHLAGDDIPCFLRSFLNCYAIDILPGQGYVFNEHATHGPPDKIFEEAAFLERFRSLLVWEDGPDLWLARATPRLWLEQGRRISVKSAPTCFGTVDFEITSDVDHGRVTATLKMPSRHAARQVWLRLRHPRTTPIRGVTVNGQDYLDWDPAREVVKVHGLTGNVNVQVTY